MVKNILYLEGLVFFVAALFFYHQQQGSWMQFMTLLFIPDISMIGYLKNKQVGATLYNFVHNYILSLLITAGGIAFKNPLLVQMGIIFFAHVALDRLLGYGLKYPSDFKDTHLKKV